MLTVSSNLRSTVAVAIRSTESNSGSSGRMTVMVGRTMTVDAAMSESDHRGDAMGGLGKEAPAENLLELRGT